MLETIDDDASPAAANSYATFDTNDVLHVAYFDSNANGSRFLNLASREHDNWEHISIDHRDGRDPVLKFAADGSGHLVYVEEQGRLRYGKYDGAQWRFRTLETGVDPVSTATIELDEHNNPHIAFGINSHPFQLYYGMIADEQWAFDALDDRGSIGDLFFDPTYNPYVAAGSGNLHFRLEGEWTSLDGITKHMASKSVVGWAAESAIEVIGYVINDDQLIHWRLDNNGTQTTIVDDAGPGGSEARFGAQWDENGNLAIAYPTRLPDGTREIRLATNSGSGWLIETIGENPFGSGVSLASNGEQFNATFWTEPGQLVVATKSVPEPVGSYFCAAIVLGAQYICRRQAIAKRCRLTRHQD